MSGVRLSFDTAPGGFEAMRGLERYVRESGLPRTLVELMKLRVSMLNACAYCVNMHWRALREAGEPEQRLYSLSAWREQPGYSPRERAALAWAECVTHVAATGVPDAEYQAVSAHFTAKELADLTYVVVAINGWNRLCSAFRIPPQQLMPERDS